MVRNHSLARLLLTGLLVAATHAACGDDDVAPRDSGTDATADTGVQDDGGLDGGADGGVVRRRLDPTTIPQFVSPLVIPPAMPPTARTASRTDYRIAVREFQQQVLPDSQPTTTVWGYGRAGDPVPGPGVSSTFNYPGFTIEARTDEVVRVEWSNQLTDESGAFLRHLLSVDPMLHWANPAGPIDSMGTDPAPYLGPVPIVPHVHGAHVPDASDGHPQAWFLPSATDLPTGSALRGTHYGSVGTAPAGAAIFEYPNDQRAGTIWYHDHAFGITRLNVYAGMAGFWLIRDAVEDALDLPGPAPTVGDAPGTRYYEIPLAVQDRSFHEDGSLFYPSSREHFDGYTGPYAPDTEVPPRWNPEFFGDVMVVNGRAWPVLDVEPRLYRFRLLNGCNSRFVILDLDRAGLLFAQIGSEGGLLSGTPVSQETILLGPGERADVIVDFSELSVGTEVTMQNLGPDEPFKGPAEVLPPADPATTGRVMRFRVVGATGAGSPGTIPTSLPVIVPLSTTIAARDLTLNEKVYEAADIPSGAFLGTAMDGPLGFNDAVTEMLVAGETEIWRLANLTVDAHPVHLHLVTFQVLDRTPFDVSAYHEAQEAFLAGVAPAPVLADYFTGPPMAPSLTERGWKDTVIANPGEVTRIIATFDLAGLYLWHCHILEHEDNEMMRPFRVTPPL